LNYLLNFTITITLKGLNVRLIAPLSDEFTLCIPSVWIIHFVKSRGEDSQKGQDRPWWRQTHADPEQSIKKYRSKLTRHWYQYRYAVYYRQRKVEALVLGRLLLNYPRSLRVIRGIDCCTDEMGVLGWVLAPLFRYLTDVGKAASQHLKVRFGENVPPLRKTVHTGEDFPHLLGGLRRIDEAVRFHNRYRVRDIQMPHSYWVLGLGKDISVMP
jgi:hypothetical protein